MAGWLPKHPEYTLRQPEMTRRRLNEGLIHQIHQIQADNVAATERSLVNI